MQIIDGGPAGNSQSAMIVGIVVRHRGRVWATGAVNQGATISFTLPVPR